MTPWAEADAFSVELLAIARATGDQAAEARIEKMRRDFPQPKRVETVPRIPTVADLRKAGGL